MRLEGQARWLQRTVMYRSGRRLQVDRQLLEAAQRLGDADLEALMSATEAAIAWRSGDRETSRALSLRVVERFRPSGREAEAQLFEALALVHAPPDPEAGARLLDAARHHPVVGMGIQIAGLVARHARLDPEAIRRLAGEVPRERWAARLDVISVAEALRALGHRPAP